MNSSASFQQFYEKILKDLKKSLSKQGYHSRSYLLLSRHASNQIFNELMIFVKQNNLVDIASVLLQIESIFEANSGILKLNYVERTRFLQIIEFFLSISYASNGDIDATAKTINKYIQGSPNIFSFEYILYNYVFCVLSCSLIRLERYKEAKTLLRQPIYAFSSLPQQVHPPISPPSSQARGNRIHRRPLPKKKGNQKLPLIEILKAFISVKLVSLSVSPG